jgi:small subunit ribosomal protein S16
VAVKIKLKRLGKIRAPYYRIIVADARTKRDGRAIEEIGKYHPKAEPSFIEVNSERAQHWLSVGAQPTDPVRKILEITGDWQKFKGLPGAEGTLKTAAPKEDRKEIFAAAVKETLGDATTPAKSRGRSGAGKDADAEKGGRGAKDAGSAKADKPARAKAGEASGKAAKSGDGGREAPAKDKAKGAAAGKAGDAEASPADDSAADAKAGDAKAADAKAGDAKAADAKAGDAKAADAKAGEAKAADAKAAEAPAGDAKAGEAKAADAKAAESEPASGD